MTDRIRHLTVTLEHDTRDDDVQPIVDAIGLICGVDSVQLGKPVGLDDWMARASVRADLRARLIETVEDFFAEKEQ